MADDAPKTAPVSADAPAPETTAAVATATITPEAPAAKPAVRGTKAPAKKTAASRETKAKAARTTTAATKAPATAAAPKPRRAPRKAEAAASPETKAKVARATAAAAKLKAEPAPAETPAPQAADAAGLTGITAVPRSIGLAAAEYVEEGTERYAAFQEALASNAPVPFIATAVRANAKFTRELGQATARSARQLLEV